MIRAWVYLLAFLFYGESAAQKVTFIPGIKISYSNVIPSPGNVDYSGYTYDFHRAGGYRIGGFGQIEFSKHAWLQLHVMLTGKKTSYTIKNYNSGLTSYRNEAFYNFLEFPLSVLYASPLRKGAFYAGGGPSPALSIWHYNTYNADKLKLGWLFTAGYRSPLDFCFEFNFGSLKLNPDENQSVPVKQQLNAVSFSIGYIF